MLRPSDAWTLDYSRSANKTWSWWCVCEFLQTWWIRDIRGYSKILQHTISMANMIQTHCIFCPIFGHIQVGCKRTAYFCCQEEAEKQKYFDAVLQKRCLNDAPVVKRWEFQHQSWYHDRDGHFCSCVASLFETQHAAHAVAGAIFLCRQGTFDGNGYIRDHHRACSSGRHADRRGWGTRQRPMQRHSWKMAWSSQRVNHSEVKSEA